MNAAEVARNNFKFWNRHDADAIAAAYAEGGRSLYSPAVPAPLTGGAYTNSNGCSRELLTEQASSIRKQDLNAINELMKQVPPSTHKIYFHYPNLTEPRLILNLRRPCCRSFRRALVWAC
jgi:hypothetical protein